MYLTFISFMFFFSTPLFLSLLHTYPPSQYSFTHLTTQAFVHVSTAFAHCNHRYIQERFYHSAITGENACKLGECLDEHTLNELTATIIKGYPNTYTYTKVLAEDIVQNYAEKLPVTIFRPGIGKIYLMKLTLLQQQQQQQKLQQKLQQQPPQSNNEARKLILCALALVVVLLPIVVAFGCSIVAVFCCGCYPA